MLQNITASGDAAVFHCKYPIPGFFTESCSLQGKNFVGDKWGRNGPQLLTRVITKHCKLESKSQDVVCNKYKPELPVLSRLGTSAVSWQKWKEYFNATVAEKTLKKVEDGFAAHYWNHMRDAWSQKKTVLYDADSALYKLFESGCPLVEAMDLRDLQGKVFDR